MKIDGRNHRIYEYKNAVVRKTPYGDVHGMINRSGYEIVLLKHDNCTKEMEHRLLNALNGIEDWNGQQVSDILYSHGKLKGYVCVKEEILEPASPPAPAYNPGPVYTPEVGNGSASENGAKKTASGAALFLENPIVRIGYFVAAVVICALISSKAIYTPLFNRAYFANRDTGRLLATFSLNGKLGIFVGIIIAVICALKLFQANSTLFFVIIPIVVLMSAGITYLLIQFTISLIAAAANIFIALLPGLVVLVIIVIGIKSILGK